MPHAPIHHTLSVQTSCWARVYVNDLPIYKRPYKGPDSIGSSINDLLVPGDNELSIQLLGTRDVGPGKHDPLSLQLRLFEVLSIEPVEVRPILELKFPDFFLEAEPAFQRYPHHYHTTFDPGVPVLVPPWHAAPTADFDCRGTQDLRDAVTRIHSAMVAGDVDRLLQEVELKLAFGAQVFAGDPDCTVAAKQALFHEFMRDGLVVRPLDFDEVHFHALHDGRVAHVARIDDAPLLYAHNQQNPNIGMSMDLLMTQHRGRWMAFT